MAERTRFIENEKGTEKLAAAIAPLLKKGDVITLRGGLGAGKTAFARALIQSLAGRPEEVPSPTFTLVQTYDLPRISIWHFDLYRLEEEEKDILELGWDEARRSGACLVEWPDRLGKLLPKDHLDIDIFIDKHSENSRTVRLTPHGSWTARLEAIG
jgi:tRNA threonylcarbamoyladenosine biosynthesis protein TsaE